MKFNKVILLLSIIFLSVAMACTFTNNPANDILISTSKLQESKTSFKPEKYICYKASEIKIDGELNEESWNNAVWTSDFVDIEGESMPAPLYNTHAKVLWDSNYLYIAAEIFEPDIWAYLKQKDTVIYYDNDFEVFIDPDGDTHGYYEFEINALNTGWDLLLTKPYRDHGRAINSWDIIGLKSAVKIYGSLNDPDDTDKKWTVEMAFPFSVLGELGNKPIDGNQWRINFSRVNWRTTKVDGKYNKEINPETGSGFNEFNWVWSAQGIINMHAPESWGYLQFSDINVGEDIVEFINRPEETIKWNLRQLYYAQRAYAEKELSYCLSPDALPNYDLQDYAVSIILTTGGYEASIQTNNKIWLINESGRIYSINKIKIDSQD